MSELYFDIDKKLNLGGSSGNKSKSGLAWFMSRSVLIRAVLSLVILVITAILPWRSIISDVFAVNGIKAGLNVLACVVIGIDIVLSAIDSLIIYRKISDCVLVFLSALITVLCGFAEAAAAALIIFQVGRKLLHYLTLKVNKDSLALMKICPKTARVSVNGLTADRETESVPVGAAIIVEAGERIPLDGIVRNGNSTLDMAELYGTEEKKRVTIGDEVLSGALNLDGQLTVEVTRVASDSTGQRALAMAEAAFERENIQERNIQSVSGKTTILILAVGIIISVILMIVGRTPFYKGAAQFAMFAAAACPGVFMLVAPLLHFSVNSRLAERGLLIKSENALLNLEKTDRVFFNKTGTLSCGKYRLVGMAAHKIPREKLLELVAYVEQGVKHPIAEAVLREVDDKVSFTGMDNRTVVPGAGVYAVIRGNDVHVGSKKLMDSIDCKVKSYGSCEFYVAINREHAGTIVMEEDACENAEGVASELHDLGVKEVAIMSSASKEECMRVSESLGLDGVYSDLRSDEKMAEMQRIKAKAGGCMTFVGRGANDGAAIAYADTGILVYSSWGDLSAKSPDVLMMNSDLHNVPKIIAAAKKLKQASVHGLIAVLILKVLLAIFAVFDVFGIWFILLVEAVAAVAMTLAALKAAGKIEI